jgi:class 3 adenylate cyclase/predicted ATPase
MNAMRIWLTDLGLAQYADAFEANDIDMELLPQVDDQALKDIGVLSTGHRLRIRGAIAKLAGGSDKGSGSGAAVPVMETRPASAERRQLTVMFSDLVGSTQLSQQLDPEALRELMQSYQRACGRVMERYDGHVAQYLGDGLMVYFGWPQAHEDDAERAVRASLEIVDAVKGVSSPKPLQVRIGIATGPVVVGETGAGDASVPKLAVGETPNLAARLQSLAGPDEIIIAPSTRRLVAAAFNHVELGPQPLKGIVEPVSPFRVTGYGQASGRFEAARGLSELVPLVGRDSELAVLRERWGQARGGEGQLVLLGGEPGIGKSRLAQTLRVELRSEPHSFVQFQCSPYHAQSALYPIIEHLESMAGFVREDDAELKLEKLTRHLDLVPGQRVGALTLFAGLLSLPLDRCPPLNYPPQKHKEELLGALADYIGAIARRDTTLLIVEDAHWMDPTTQEMLDVLVTRLPQCRVLAMVTHRPEYVPRWSGDAHVSTMTLNRLNRRLGTQLAEGVTGGKPLPREVIDQVLAKTDGVPLFVEELTKTILESGVLRDAGSQYVLDGSLPPLAIPSTLRDSLMARLDRLAPVKEIAQIGACIGREFSFELIASVGVVPKPELEEGLQRLVESQLIFKHGSGPAALYSFKHALVRDAAYGSLLNSRKQQLHKLIVTALQRHFTERVENEPEVIAHHYTEARLAEEATDAWLQAGERALNRFANAEAIAHLRRGLQTCELLAAGPARDQRELRLQTALGTALGASQGYTPPEVGQAFSRALELSERAGDMPQKFSITFGLWIYYLMRAEYVTARPLADQLLEIAVRTNDEDQRIAAHCMIASTACFEGRFSQAREHAEAGCKAYETHGVTDATKFAGLDPGPLTYDALMWTLCELGYFDDAHAAHLRGVEIVESQDDPLTLGTGLVHAAGYQSMCGDAPLTLQFAQRAFAVCQENSILIRLAEANIFGGWARAELGEPAVGIPLIESGIDVWHQVGARIADPQWYVLLARARMTAGHAMEARAALKKGIECARQTGERMWEPELYRLEGEWSLSFEGDRAGAEAHYRDAIAAAREIGSRLWELRAAVSMARMWSASGKAMEARAILEPLYQSMPASTSSLDMQEARALLSEVGEQA